MMNEHNEIIKILENDFIELRNKYSYSVLDNCNLNNIKIDIINICNKYKQSGQIANDIGFDIVLCKNGVLEFVLNKQSRFDIIK